MSNDETESLPWAAFQRMLRFCARPLATFRCPIRLPGVRLVTNCFTQIFYSRRARASASR
jgi:hypothetical protein